MPVFGSSTLILLARIDMLEIFISHFQGNILIHEKVKSEVCLKGREEKPVIEKIIKDKKIKTLQVMNKKQIEKLIDEFNIEYEDYLKGLKHLRKVW